MNRQFDIKALVRPNIRALKPYRSARDDFDSGILLDANENSLGAPWPEAEARKLNRYPSPLQMQLKKRIAEWRKVETGQIFTGVGSDEAIDLLFRIFCRPGKDRIITTPPTYGMYGVSAAIHDAEVKEVALDDEFQPQVDRILEQAGPNTKLLFLCSPNNPTGNVLDPEKVERLISGFPGIVVVDEAYIDFSSQPSMAAKISHYPNLVVLQTMSKSFGLAGIRLGIAFASGEIIGYMNKVKAPYNINLLTAEYAIKAFDNLETVEKRIDSIVKERQRLREQLQSLPAVQHIFSADANFLLVKIANALEIYKALAREGVIVRYRGNEPGCENCLRITVGTPQENDTLITKLKKVSS